MHVLFSSKYEIEYYKPKQMYTTKHKIKLCYSLPYVTLYSSTKTNISILNRGKLIFGLY